MSDPVRVRRKAEPQADPRQFTASEAKHRFGELLDTALRTGPVTITRQNKAAAVLISIEAYRSLTQAGERALAELSAEFDRQFEAMQAPGVAEAMQRVFDTPPAVLGEFAVASIRGSRPPKRKATRRQRGSDG